MGWRRKGKRSQKLARVEVGLRQETKMGLGQELGVG